jgi:hypothetical protein
MQRPVLLYFLTCLLLPVMDFLSPLPSVNMSVLRALTATLHKTRGHTGDVGREGLRLPEGWG